MKVVVQYHWRQHSPRLNRYWQWLARSLLAEVHNRSIPADLVADDIVIRDAHLGMPTDETPARLVLHFVESDPESSCQEVATPAARDRLQAAQDGLQRLAALVTPDRFNAAEVGASVVPWPVDVDIFRPLDRAACRRLHHISPHARVGLWAGRQCPADGHELYRFYAEKFSDIRWLVLPEGREEAGLPYQDLPTLMGAADFVLLTHRLRPYRQVDLEAMACGLPTVNLRGLERDFDPQDHPRESVLSAGHHQLDVISRWSQLLSALPVS